MAFLVDECRFQFQTGSIKSAGDTTALSAMEVFQFQTGSIRRRQRERDTTSVGIVSIPNWFD